MLELKDQFALAAMAALLQRTSNSSPHYADVANSAWQCAEFMMSERKKRMDLAALNEKRNNSDMRTLKLTTRLHYALLSEDLYTIADICAYTEKEILTSGTRYVVRKQGATKNSSLHHSCHVVLFD